MVLASACLCGIRCRWDAGSRPHPRFTGLLATGECQPFCPEQLGMLTTPREPAEISGGDGFDVLDGSARVLLRDRPGDVTDSFLLGAERAVMIARILRPESICLKEKSPSCGLQEGPSAPGVAAAALIRAGFDPRSVRRV